MSQSNNNGADYFATKVFVDTLNKPKAPKGGALFGTFIVFGGFTAFVIIREIYRYVVLNVSSFFDTIAAFMPF